MFSTPLGLAAIPSVSFSFFPLGTAIARALGTLLNPVMGPEVACLPVLLFAIFTEGLVVLAAALIRKKPVRRLLLACALANCVTVTALTVLLEFIGSIVLGTAGIVAVLVEAEVAIWLFEAFFMHQFRGTQVSWKEALAFSLAMNLGSLAAGWGLVAFLSSLSAPA